MRLGRLVIWTVVTASGVAASQTARVVLRWSAVPEARGYELHISRDPSFTDLALQTKTDSPVYRWEQLPQATHWWRVRSFDKDGRPSEWSAPRTVLVGVPVPVLRLPMNGSKVACGTPVQLAMEPSPLTREFLVELGPLDGSTSRELRSAEPSVTLTDLEPGTYTWRARAVDLRRTMSEPSTSSTFTVQLSPPRPKPVPDVEVGASAMVAWTAVPCARSYLVEVLSDGEVRRALPAAGTTLLLTTDRPGDYRLRVVGIAAGGARGETSAEVTFVARLPAPVVEDSVVGAGVRLSWRAVPGATTYRLRMAQEDQWEGASEVSLESTQWESGALTPGRWGWSVWALDESGRLSKATEGHRMVAPPAPLTTPSIVVPSPDAVFAEGADLEVRWSTVPDAQGYEVEFDGAELPALGGPTLELPSVAAGEHQLRVRARADGSRESPWSVATKFWVGVPPVRRVVVSQRGHEVEVELLDERARPVAGAKPTFQVARGTLSAAEERSGGRWVMGWAPPADRLGDELTVTQGDLRAVERLRHPLVEPWSVGLRAGGVFNGAAVASPSVVATATYRFDWLDRRFGIEARAQVYQARSAVQVGEQEVAGSAWVLPLTLAVAFRQPLGAFSLAAALGPALQIGWVQVGTEREVRALPGVEFAAVLSRRVGPGNVEAEVGVLYSRLDTPLARLNAGGIGFRVGYSYPFGAR